MAEKAMLVPLPGDGANAREILAELKRLMGTRISARHPLGRPLGQKIARNFADRLRQARYVDQQNQRRQA